MLDVVRALAAVRLDRLAVLVGEEDEFLIDFDPRLLERGVDDLERGVVGQINLDGAVVTLNGDEDGMG